MSAEPSDNVAGRHVEPVRPPLHDGAGYAICWSDLAFLGIGEDDFVDWSDRRRPLGVSRVQFRGFARALAQALALEGLEPEADIRLQGSSAHFFAGAHKPMPADREAIIDEFCRVRRRPPEDFEVEEIEDRLNAWLRGRSCPRRRPFDSLHRLSLDGKPSDLDLQVSSDVAVQRCRSRLEDLRISPTEFRVSDPNYNFVRRHFYEDAIPHLYRFARRASDQFNGRRVTLALFPLSGPPDTSSTGVMSAHFRDTDWRLGRDLVRDNEAAA